MFLGFPLFPKVLCVYSNLQIRVPTGSKNSKIMNIEVFETLNPSNWDLTGALRRRIRPSPCLEMPSQYIFNGWGPAGIFFYIPVGP